MEPRKSPLVEVNEFVLHSFFMFNLSVLQTDSISIPVLAAFHTPVFLLPVVRLPSHALLADFSTLAHLLGVARPGKPAS